MPTEKQLAARSKGIGSSDMASIMGLNPFQTAYDVWVEKTGKIESVDAPNEAMIAGTLFEKGVLMWARGILGKMRHNQFRTAPEYNLLTHIDAVVVDSGAPVEAKTAGLKGAPTTGWGEPDTDEVPDPVIIQSHVHMICLDYQNVCFVPAFLAFRGFQMFVVNFNSELAERIKEAAVHFWENHVVTDIPPKDSAPSLNIARHLRRVPQKMTAISESLLRNYIEASRIASEAEKAKREATAFLLGALGDAEYGNRITRTMTRLETAQVLTLLAYALAAGASLLIGYLAWRKIRRQGPYEYPGERDK